jgi:magnesium chelatase subunit I
MKVVFPFSAIAAQDEMKTALMIAAVDPGIGGVLIFGDRGTGKSPLYARWQPSCRP